ncbi:MAG TPA: glycosyltransferase family 2 protein [Gemmatimonadales bacterium]
MRLLVLLSTYNGARYLAEQIESIRGQIWTGWELVVRDDGSTDGTIELVEEFARRDRRIRLWRDGRGNLGPAASFGALLEHAWAGGATYAALADQDDVWMPDKLQRELALLQAHEAAGEPDHPLLVHTDLTVVDDRLRTLHPSFLRHQRLEHVRTDPLRRLLVQNFVTGCTVVVNRALLRAAIPVPPVVMHDWWLAQCAAALGTILFLPEPTVRYRQHGGNALGGRGALRLYADAVRRPAEWWVRGRRGLAAGKDQASELARRLEVLAGMVPVDPRTTDLVRRYAAALDGSVGPLRRLREIRRLRVRPRSLFSPLFYLRVLAGFSKAG